MINLNPIARIVNVPVALTQAINDRLREIVIPPAVAATPPAATAAAGQLFWRTLDLNNAAVGNNIAPNVIVFGAAAGPSHTIVGLAGVLRLAITEDLTVQINNVSPAGTVSVGSFTIPAATPVDTPVVFSAFDNIVLPDLSVLTFDVTASDGSADPDGVATFTLAWTP